MVRLDKWLEDWMHRKEGPDEYGWALFAALCWVIWKARCRYIFEHCEVNAVRCVEDAMRLVKEYGVAMEKNARRMAQEDQNVRKVR